MSDVSLATNRAWYERFGIISIVTLLFAIPLLYLHHRWEYEENKDLVFMGILAKEAGTAAFVAFFLNLSVEWINRRRHAEQELALVKQIDEKHHSRLDTLLEKLRDEHKSQLATLGNELEAKHEVQREKLVAELDKKYDEKSKKLLKNVFQTVYERYIQPEVFTFIDKHVLRRDVMRKNYKATLTIKPLNGNNPDNLIQIQFYNSYDLINLAGKDLDNQPYTSAIIDIPAGYEEYCKFTHVSINGVKIPDQNLVEYVQNNEEGAYCQLLVRGDIKTNKSVRVEIQYQKVAPRTSSEVICSTVQMDSFTMETFCNDKDLCLFATSLHPEPEVPEPHPLNPDYKVWKINHAIIPGQGMVVYWHPKVNAPLIDLPVEALPLA